MAQYRVILPIAGHVFITVEANTDDEAKEKALEANLGDKPDLEWDVLERFNEGNVCYCPSPWEIEVELEE